MLKSFQLKNFKAVRDSGLISLTPLTVFIGNNGSGKSSVIEGLATYRMIVTGGLNSAMKPWQGFEHIRNNAVTHVLKNLGVERPFETNPIEFKLSTKTYQTTMTVTKGQGINEVFIQSESLKLRGQLVAKRNAKGEVYLLQESDSSPIGKWSDDESMIDSGFLRSEFWVEKLPIVNTLNSIILRWQFLNLNSHLMGLSVTQKDSTYNILLDNDGSSLSKYLRLIYQQDEPAFNGIVQTLRYVLPYTDYLEPKLTSERERNLYLELTESDMRIPGWLLSTGTLRILALLAILRNPNPAPLIVIEEIENGLDPRTIHLIVEEIQNVIEAGKTQVIFTTHSPYLLDLLSLSHIVLVERDETGQPVFNRPANQESLQEWSKHFAPGSLYTMGKLSREGSA